MTVALPETAGTTGIECSLDLVAPWLSSALCAPSALARLREMMARMPRVHRAGFECRMLQGDDQVDVQQGVIRTDAEVCAVRRFAARQGAATTGRTRDAWGRVDHLCSVWQDPESTLSGAIDELWLEFDAIDDTVGEHAALVPSVFAVLKARNAHAVTAGHRRRNAIADVLDVAGILLGEADAMLLRDTLAAWHVALESLAPVAHISHIGAMLGREPSGVRLHVSALPSAAMGDFLAAIGWRGPMAAAVAATRAVFDHVDEVVLCFDLALVAGTARLLPRVGLEAFFEQRSGLDPRWEPFLQSLVDRGLASPDRASALLRWPGTLAPSPRHRWPDELVLRSLLAPSHHLGMFERRLSHLKLSVDQAGMQSAKAYFGYGHLWADRSPANANASASVNVNANAAAIPGIAGALAQHARAADDAFVSPVDGAIERATHFLLDTRNQGGWWRDFYDIARPTRVGQRVVGYASDEWVTAYVGCALAGVGSSMARRAAQSAWSLLAARRGEGGWGYHAQLPADADSTTWALRLAGMLGESAERLRGARAFLHAQTHEDGGVACYREVDCPAIASFLRMSGPYHGWCAAHVCITAAVADLSIDPRHLQFVREAQDRDGRWRGHWWDDDEYATALATVAVARTDRDREALQRAAQWASARVGSTGAVHSAALAADSPFATSLVLRTLRAAGPVGEAGSAADRALEWLLTTQRPDGSWVASSRLRVPAPAALDPLADPGTTITYLDYARVFTTATVLATLAQLVTSRAPRGVS